MINPKDQQKNNSIPIVLQSFGLGLDYSSNSNSRVKPNKKSPEEKYKPCHQYQQPSRLQPQTSRKKLDFDQRTITQHYQNMQKILISENLNLKQHNSYLTAEVRKSLRREEKAKQEQKLLIVKLKKKQEEYKGLEIEYIGMKTLIQKQLGYLSDGIKSNNIYQLKNMVWRFIDEISLKLSITIEQHFAYTEGIISREMPGYEESRSEIDQQIEFLTKRLEKLINQDHSASKGPAVRRQCIEISKQLKQLKEQSRSIASYISQHNQPSDIKSDYVERPRQSAEKGFSRDDVLKKQFLRSDSIKQEYSGQMKRFSGDLSSKITRRKTLNRDSKVSSRKQLSGVMSPPGSGNRVQ